MKDGKRLNHVDHEVWYLPCTAREAAWRRYPQRMYYNDLMIGASDPLADERLLLGAVGGEDSGGMAERFEKMKEYAVSLRPRSVFVRDVKKMKEG
ncbi:MAG: hypothetical protein ACYC9J_00775 [Sulfuricaulis sp.]